MTVMPGRALRLSGAPPRRHFSLKWHLAWLIFAALLPAIVFAGIMMSRLLEQERRAWQDRLDEKAIQLAGAIDTELRQTIAALEVLALSNTLVAGDLREFHAAAVKLAEAQPTWANVQLLGVQGEHLLNARLPYGTVLPPLNRPELPMEAARTRRPLVSDMAKAVVANRFLTVVYVPVLERGAVKYVLSAAIETPNWTKVLQKVVPAGMQAVLLDRQRQVIASTSEGELVAGRLVPESFLPSASSGVPGVANTRLDGVVSYAASRQSFFSDWTVAAFVPVQLVEASVRASFNALAIAFLLVLAAGLSLAFAFAHRIGRSISQLVASVRAVSTGTAPLPVPGRISEMQEATRALTDTAALMAADIEERKRSQAIQNEAEKALHQANEQLRESDRRKDEFLATLAHELRNPLAPICNAVQIMRTRALPEQTLQSAHDIVERQVQHMVRLIDDLLDVSRITQGKLELRRERVVLEAVIEQALETMRPHLQHEFTVSLPPGPLHVDADPVRLAQVFANLLVNACKYTGRGGRISLSVEREGSLVVARVRDSGIGIPAEQLGGVFRMFSQLSGGHERAQGGLGIGLSLSRSLVEMHGGTIEAHSEGRNRGSEFVVRLPLSQKQSGEGAAQARQASSFNAQLYRQILVVEDNRDSAESLAMLLSMQGGQVEVAHDGLAALDKAEACRPDLVLLDLGLPKMSGYDACRTMRARPWGRQAIVIAMSGWGQEEDRQKSKEAGFDAHLVKPVEYGELMSLLCSIRAAGTTRNAPADETGTPR
jgi:signal transduction histidine kinase/ActR/RegA family two-component response regulator